MNLFLKDKNKFAILCYNYKMLKYLIFLLFCYNLINAKSLIINDHQNIYDKFQFLYIKDKNSSITYDDIKNEKFINTSSNQFALGYTKGTLWIKIDIENKSSIGNNFVLSLGESFYEKANLYYIDNGNLKVVKNGLFTPISDRSVYSHHLAFNLSITENTSQSIYLELKGKYAYFGNITITKEKYFKPYSFLDIKSFYLFLFGIGIIIVIFNLFLYIRLRERIYAYYVGYSFFNLLYIINISGLLVYIDMQQFIYKLHFSASLLIAFLILFSYEILELKKYIPKISRFVPYLSIPSFFFGIMILFNYQPWNKFINNYAGLITLILIILSCIVYFKGHKKSSYYIYAMVLYFTFVILFTFMVLGIFDYSVYTRYGFVFASAIELIVFSLMLSGRYYDISEEFIKTQNELINIKNHNETFLENEIKQRTKQLEYLVDEREMLLKEVHHRVKNNFHTLIGLLWLEEQQNSSDTEKFQSLRNRIKSMSMIHEKLYQSSDLKNIPIKVYLEEITNNLFSIKKDVPVEFNLNIDDLVLKFDSAISLGIIVNEVLSNALKHNKDSKNLKIDIILTSENDNIILQINDNGKGFSNTHLHQGLGMDIISSFSNKLPNSTFNFDTTNGVKFKLQFKSDKE